MYSTSCFFCFGLIQLTFTRVKGFSQEIGKVVSRRGHLDFSKYPIGSTLQLLPFHVRNTRHTV